MKKFICGFLIGAMLFGVLGTFAVSYVANPLSYKVLVNGEEFTSDPPPVEIEGRTYLPLRAMGDALGVPVNWNEELWQAEVGTAPEPTATPEPEQKVYKTYIEDTEIVDFGDFSGAKFLSKRYSDDGGYVMYFYDRNSVDEDVLAEKVGYYLVMMRDKGYTIKDDDDPSELYYSGINFDTISYFSLSYEFDVKTFAPYVVIAIY